MIAKKIHYCWFGRNPLPESALKCIASWRKYFPDYEIIEWNEENFDVNIIPYTRQAYEAKKYAFVSDYARFWILYHYGGLYFDTDVEVIRPMEDIVEAGSFMGFEINPEGDNSQFRFGAVNPGLGIGATPKLNLYSEVLNFYSEQHFLNPDGTLNTTTVVTYTTDILIRHGLKDGPVIQTVAEVNIYPKDFFNPLNDNTGKLAITNNTRSIHWYTKTWGDTNSLRKKISRFSHRVFGVNTVSKLMNKLRTLWK